MAQWRLAATQAIGEQEAKGINVDLIALIFCLIFSAGERATREPSLAEPFHR